MTRPAGFKSPFAPYISSMRDPDPAKGRQAVLDIFAKSEGELAVFNLKALPWPQATRVKQLFDEIYGPLKQ